jgi:hypothetical protein
MFCHLKIYVLLGLFVCASCSVKEAPEESGWSAEKHITVFTFRNVATLAVNIDEAAATIAAVIPYGADRSALTPVITHTGFRLSPADGVSRDFSSPVTYTVTAQDSSKRTYTVSVSNAPSDVKTITQVEFNAAGTLVWSLPGSAFRFLAPYGADRTQLVPGITYIGASIHPDVGAPQDFTAPVTYTVTAADGSTADYTIEVLASNLPVMVIATPGSAPIVSRDDWMAGATYTLYDGELQRQNGQTLTGVTDIKGRGNSTWELFSKKPYTLKLAKDGQNALQGLPAHRRWALLANYADKSLLRNAVTFAIGQLFNDLQWTPHGEHAVLFLNGEYRGLYQLVEQIKIDANRVPVSTTISKKKPDGGYLLELDARLGEVFNFTTTHGVPVCCSDPDEDLEDVIARIKADVQQAEDALYATSFRNPATGYRNYFDVASCVDYYLVNEIVKNPDTDWGSVYVYYEPTAGKYFMGPLWDFDISLGNNNDGIASRWPTGFMVKDEAFWLPRMMEDPDFVALVKARWNEKKAAVRTMLQYINDEAQRLDAAQALNFTKWDILNQQIWPDATVKGSYAAEIAYLHNWLETRLAWLDNNF